MILLETARLRLRRFVPADLDRLVEIDSDPEVMRHITYGIPTPRERYELEILPRWLAFQEAAISIEANQFDAGEVWEGDVVTHSFAVKNTGKAELSITNVKPG